jgi:hypothetical protein
MHTKFYNDWFSHSKVDGGDIQTHRQHGDRISLLSFFKNKESMLKLRKNEKENEDGTREERKEDEVKERENTRGKIKRDGTRKIN